MIAMRRMTWNIGERIFKDDYIIYKKKFSASRESVALYVAEI